jgi:hypothetical protein
MCWSLVLATEGDRVQELDALAARLDRDLPARPRQFVSVPTPQHATAVLLHGGCEPPQGRGGLGRSVSDLCALAAAMCDDPPPCCSQGAGPAAAGGWGPTVTPPPATENRGPLAPVACLDQLLAQASGVDRLVRPKVRAWGVLSGAHYRLAGTHSHVVAFEPWADLGGYPGGGEAGGGGGGRVRWAQCKSRQRAVEKLYRVYRLDVSMLVRPGRVASEIVKSQARLACGSRTRVACTCGMRPHVRLVASETLLRRGLGVQSELAGGRGVDFFWTCTP